MGYTILLISSAVAAWFLLKKRTKCSFPPGPPPMPILGNVLDMPDSYMWLTFSEWSNKYGDVVHLNLLGRHIIILDSLTSVKDLMDGRSAIYSDRPHVPMVMDLQVFSSLHVLISAQSCCLHRMGWNWALSALHYNDNWKRHRKVFQQCFNADSISKYRDVQAHEAQRTALYILESPADFMELIRL